MSYNTTKAEIQEVEAIIAALEIGDVVAATRLARDKLYYLQEIDMLEMQFDEEQDTALKVGLE